MSSKGTSYIRNVMTSLGFRSADLKSLWGKEPSGKTVGLTISVRSEQARYEV